jgi:hypothetical protein
VRIVIILKAFDKVFLIFYDRDMPSQAPEKGKLLPYQSLCADTVLFCDWYNRSNYFTLTTLNAEHP